MTLLGIDAGATATKWLVLDETGATFSGKSQAMDGHIYRPESEIRIKEVLADIADMAAQTAAHEVTAICAGFTGLAHSGADQEALKALFNRYFPKAKVSLMSDIELAYRAHLQPGEGILLYAGTGSVAMHITEDQRVICIGGWGYLLGDEGAGYWIGREAIRHTLMTLENGTSNALSTAIAEALGASNWGEMRTAIYGQDRSIVAALTPTVRNCALEGDQSAIEILAHAAGELAELIYRTDRVIGEDGLPIIFSGGIAQQIPEIFSDLVSIFGSRVLRANVDIAAGAATLAGKLG